ncbi:MAG: AAA family ATPase [Deltaproteobacteria bacterium]|nr:AAA family ATPase [Deltaproteobacteria bacterium]
MSTQFSIYYNSLENKEYLRKIIEASDTGKLVESQDLAHLPSEAAHGIDVVFLEYQENNPELDHWIERIAVNPRSPAIFLYFREISTNNLWKALRLGAKECFTFPIQEADFQQAVKRLVARMEVSKGRAKPTRIISFLGCKGGIGTSFLVANLASLLAQERRGKVLVIDLDLGFGQLNYFFDVHPEHTLAELIDNLERLDNNYIQNIFYPIGDNFYLLPAPARLEEAEAINASHLEKIIGYLKNNLGFRWILIDCCHQLDEITMKALEFSESLMLVTGQSIPALSNAKKMLEILTLLELKELEVEVLVNYWDRQHELGLSDVENFLGKKIAGTITCDYKQASFSVNEGKLLVETSPRHPISVDLKLIAGKIGHDDLPEETNGSGWKWLRGLWSKKKP